VSGSKAIDVRDHGGSYKLDGLRCDPSIQLRSLGVPFLEGGEISKDILDSVHNVSDDLSHHDFSCRISSYASSLYGIPRIGRGRSFCQSNFALRPKRQAMIKMVARYMVAVIRGLFATHRGGGAVRARGRVSPYASFSKAPASLHCDISNSTRRQRVPR
jgi:hypothetical protein